MKKISPFFITVFFVWICFSCGSRSEDVLEKEVLFDLNYGKTEDQLNVYHEPGRRSLYKDRLLMRDGLFYVSNGQSQKIMEFNSYGDIINLYYNSATNPEPVLLQPNTSGSLSATRNVYSYPFQDIGEIGLTGRRMLLADDRIGEARVEYDPELGSVLDRIILQFDSQGNFLDYLGQEGSGGTPFPYIDKIRVTQWDELVVFTRNPAGWKVFWFSDQGRPLYIVNVLDNNLPHSSDMVKNYGFSILENLDCSNTERLLYLKIDSYIDYSQVLETERTGIEFASSQIWTQDVTAAETRYIANLEIPGYFQGDSRGRVFTQEERSLIYEFIGVAGAGYFYLMSLNGENSYNLMIMDQEGRVFLRKNIILGNQRLNFKVFHVGSTGILTALLGWEDRAEVAWWRTDAFLPKEEP